MTGGVPPWSNYIEGEQTGAGPIDADGETLRLLGRSVHVPFRVEVKSGKKVHKLVCRDLLRVLPGKRMVCTGEWENQQVVVKFFLDTWRAKRHFAREEQGVNALKAGGIKTPDVFFKGRLVNENTPVLCIKRIVGSQDASEVWEKAGSEERGDLMYIISSTIGDQHEAGLIHEDQHLGNFLLAGNTVYTIDGDAVDSRYAGKPLGEEKSIKNMGKFFSIFPSGFEPIFPKAFDIYLKKRSWNTGALLYRKIVPEIRKHRIRAEKKYLKKIYRECSSFVAVRSWSRIVVCDRAYHTDGMARLLAEPDRSFGKNNLLKDGNSSTVALVESDGLRFAVKRYNIKNTIHRLKRCLRPSRAAVSWRNSHLLGINGISTPKPLAFLERRWGPFRSTSYFITEYVDGTDTHTLFHSDGINDIDRKNVSRLFLDLIKQLADGLICHGDFKATNFIYAGGRIFVTDLDAMRKHCSRRKFRREFRKDMVRFMKNWSDLPETVGLFDERLKMTDM